MISEPQEELACLYVLGLLDPRESAAFETEIQHDLELSELVASLNNATLSLARTAPLLTLPASARQRLLAAVSGEESTIVPFRAKQRSVFLPWAAAACLVGLLLFKSVGDHREKVAFRSSFNQLNRDLKNAQQQLALAETARVDLLAKLSLLEKKDLIAQAQVAVLSSLIKDRPQAVAVSLWDQEKQNGLLVVENLPVLESGKDYQLWVLDPNSPAPVSAGVFKVDAAGKVRLIFKPNQAIQTAAKFAVTEETEGGVASPTMDKMVVIGGI
jgi:anti-sigma-K factor RskA